MAQQSMQAELQKTFITMLFAFAVSVVALGFADWFVVLTENWRSAQRLTQTYATNAQELWALAAVGTHYLLALLMLSMSWVMWSRSQAHGHLEDVKDFLTLKFFSFLMEVILVTLYFSLARTAEGDFTAYSKDKALSSYLTPASAVPEAFQMTSIFFIFMIWDYIADVARSPLNPLPVGFLASLWSRITGFLTYCFVSASCTLLALLVYLLAEPENAPNKAIAGDISLIVLLFMFDRGKILENYLFKIFPQEKTRDNTKRQPTSLIPLGLMTILFSLSLWVAS